VHGGQTGNGAVLGDMHLLQLNCLTWLQVRAAAAAVADAYNNIQHALQFILVLVLEQAACLANSNALQLFGKLKCHAAVSSD
jgi:hypothetical protein